METKENEMLTAREVAAMLRVTDRRVRQLASRGEFVTPIRVGPRTLRFERADVLAWIESKKAA